MSPRVQFALNKDAYEALLPGGEELSIVGLKRHNFRNRAGRCFELAYVYLADSSDEVPWRLIHGDVAGENNPIEHAWLETDTLVYDAVIDRFYQPNTYYEQFKAVAKVRYSKREAAVEVLKAGHSGPWQRTAAGRG